MKKLCEGDNMKRNYTIGEICKIYNIGPDSLRYYEKKGLIKPQRKNNGYRIYSLEEIWRLNLIKDLRKLDFSVQQIKTYIDSRNINTTKELMEKEIMLIEKEIKPLIRVQNKLKSKLKLMKDFEKLKESDKIQIKKIKNRKIIFIEAEMTKDEEVDLALRRLESKNDEKLFLFANKDMGVFISNEGMEEKKYDLYDRAFFLLDDTVENYNMILPEGYYATRIYRGDYKQSQKLIAEMISFIEKENYIINGKPMEIYRVDIHDTSIEEEFITEIQIPIVEK